MKKLMFLLFFVSQYSFAQMEIKKFDGTPINNGDILSFNSIDASIAKMKFRVYNTSNEPITVKLRCNNINNASGTSFNLCFGDQCYEEITAGGIYPPNGAIIPANGANGIYDYFWNSNTGSGTFPLDYSFRFYMVDANSVAIGAPLNFTYRYDPSTVGISSFKESTVVSPTLATDFVNIQSEVKVKTILMDLQGRILQDNMAKLNPVINVSELSPQTYLLVCEDEQGNKFTQRIIKH